MASTDTKIVFIKDFIALTGDPGRDMLISALAAAEKREGERKGWDQAPQVWELRLIRPGELKLSVMPEDSWMTGLQNPADDLVALASPLPDPPLDIPQLPLGKSLLGFAGIAFMSEGWARPEGSPPATGPEPPGRGDPHRLNEFHPDRIEMRTVVAVDVNGLLYGLCRERGGEVTHTVSELPSMWGSVPRALHKMCHAIRVSIESRAPHVDRNYG